MSSTILLDKILEEYAEQLGMGKPGEKDQVFEIFSAEQLLKDKDLDDIEIKNGLTGGGFDNGIDGLYLFVDEEYISSIEQIESIVKAKVIEVHIHQYKNKSKIEENVVHKFNSAAAIIFSLDHELKKENWGDEIFESIEKIRKIIVDTASSHPKYKVVFRHVSKGESSSIYDEERPNISYLEKVEILKNTMERSDLDNVIFDFKFIGNRELRELNRKEKQYSLPLKLNENPIALEYVENGKRGYIASVNLKDYYHFISEESNELRKYLFDSNIRDYQNNTMVNGEIINSINIETEIDFWWLNNGITIIANNGSLTGKTLHLDNVQIVNGLQTSYSIFHAFTPNQPENEKRSLLLKIVITEDKATSDKIIKSTNSQNTVPSSLLRATDQIQRDIEEYFLANDLFYDRRKNYYKNLKKPVKKIISINFLAQCLTSLVIEQKNPSKARSNPTILTKEEDDYRNLFSESRSMDTYLNAVLIVKEIERIIKETVDQQDELEEKIKKYYLFHIARIAVSLHFSQPNYGSEQIGKISIDFINDELVLRSIETLKKILDQYISETSHTDYVNISKQTEFSRFITSNIVAFF